MVDNAAGEKEGVADWVVKTEERFVEDGRSKIVEVEENRTKRKTVRQKRKEGERQGGSRQLFLDETTLPLDIELLIAQLPSTVALLMDKGPGQTVPTLLLSTLDARSSIEYEASLLDNVETVPERRADAAVPRGGERRKRRAGGEEEAGNMNNIGARGRRTEEVGGRRGSAGRDHPVARRLV
ncbi:hypothetical protein KM043_004028 [Ampulex compressa]|nr:hypothetical protein KM043_004028 [Ampulex compressa]